MPCLELPIYNEYFLLNISSAGARTSSASGRASSTGNATDAPLRPSYDAALAEHADDGRPLDEVVTEGGSRTITTAEGVTIGGREGQDDGLTDLLGGTNKPGAGN